MKYFLLFFGSVSAFESNYSVEAGAFTSADFWTNSPCDWERPKGYEGFFAKPSYMYTIDKFSINNKVRGWFQHVEFCVTKDANGKLWLNAATHIFPP